MKTIDVLNLFGSKYAVGKALKVDPNQVYKWPEIVPDLRQLQLEMLTKGKLQAEDRLKPWLKRARKAQEPRSDAAATQMPPVEYHLVNDHPGPLTEGKPHDNFGCGHLEARPQTKPRRSRPVPITTIMAATPGKE